MGRFQLRYETAFVTLALADRLADAAMQHLRRSQELAAMARRIRVLVTQEGLLRQIAKG